MPSQLGSFGDDVTLFSELIFKAPAKWGSIVEPKRFLGAQTAPANTCRGNKMFLKLRIRQYFLPGSNNVSANVFFARKQKNIWKQRFRKSCFCNNISLLAETLSMAFCYVECIKDRKWKWSVILKAKAKRRSPTKVEKSQPLKFLAFFEYSRLEIFVGKWFTWYFTNILALGIMLVNSHVKGIEDEWSKNNSRLTQSIYFGFLHELNTSKSMSIFFPTCTQPFSPLFVKMHMTWM